MERARALEKLAEMYWRQSKLSEAQPLLERALAIHEEISGPESVETAVALTKLACLYSEQGKDGDSQLLCGHSLAIADSIVDKLARPPSNLSERTSTQLRNKIPAPETTAAILENRRIRKGLRVLAQLYSDQATRFLNRDKYDAAQPLLQRALVMIESLPGNSEGNNLAMIVSKLAWLSRRTGKPQEAQTLGARAVELSEDAAGGAPSAELALCYSNYAVLLREQGKTAEAQALYQRAIGMHNELQTHHSPEMGAILQNQAFVHCEQGEMELALQCAEQSLGICENILGSNHPQTWYAMKTVAVMLHKNQKFRESGAIFTHLAALLHTCRPTPDRFMTEILAGWAGNCLAVGQMAEARKLFTSCLVHAKKINDEEMSVKFFQDAITSIDDATQSMPTSPEV